MRHAGELVKKFEKMQNPIWLVREGLWVVETGCRWQRSSASRYRELSVCVNQIKLIAKLSFHDKQFTCNRISLQNVNVI